MDRRRPVRAPAQTRPRRVLARALAIALVAVVLVIAAGVVVAKTVSTSSARVAASTSSGGILTAGTVDIARADGSASLLFDADNLYPGRVVVGCVVLGYGGSVPAALRLHGDRGGGTGLDDYVDLTLTTSTLDACPTVDPASGDPATADPATADPATADPATADPATADPATADPAAGDGQTEVFRGRLSELWAEHGEYSTGIDIATQVAPGDRLVLRAVAVVVDDDRAAGLTTDFVFTIEGRPT